MIISGKNRLFLGMDLLLRFCPELTLDRAFALDTPIKVFSLLLACHSKLSCYSITIFKSSQQNYLTIRLLALVFYEQIVNEAQPS